MTSTFGDKDIESFGVLRQISSMLLYYLILVFSYPNLLSRHYFFINARKSVPPPQYCNAVKDQVQTRVFTGVSPFILFYQMVNFQASILRQASFRVDLVPQSNTRSGGGSDLHFSLRSLHILSKSLLLDLHPSPRLIPTLEAMVVDFGPAFLVSALVNITSPYPSRLSSTTNDIFRCMQNIWCSVVVKVQNS